MRLWRGATTLVIAFIIRGIVTFSIPGDAKSSSFGETWLIRGRERKWSRQTRRCSGMLQVDYAIMRVVL